MHRRQARTGLELRSIVKPDSHLELSLQRVEIGTLAPDELVVSVDAAPINPSDISLLLGRADLTQARAEGDGEDKRVLIPLTSIQASALSRRMNISICPGLEGAGRVVDAGSDGGHLIGKTVAMFGGKMFTQFRTVTLKDCLVFPEGTSPTKCAASFVNPLTVLCILETLRSEGHKALVHTAAASNLGQMLNKLCIQDRIDIVNIVRSPDQAKMLRDIGANYVCDSTSPVFVAELTTMIRATGATLAFDAIGGGTLASTILKSMESVFAPMAGEYSNYGSSVHKQVYVYGTLDVRPIEIQRGAGSAWGVSGWLMMNYLAKLAPEVVFKMKERVVSELDTIFSSRYGAEISLFDALDVATLTACSRRSTGTKYLLSPTKSI